MKKIIYAGTGLFLLAATALGSTHSVSGSIMLDSRDYTLTVSSDHGTPVPTLGAHSNYCWKSTVTCSVNSAVSENGTNYTCTGWSGTGSITTSGATNNTGAILLTNVASSIAWQWALITDTDADGIPDSWEQKYFGSSTNANPNAICSNGINTVRQAYIAGLDPTNSQSVLRATASSNGKTLGWNAASGRVYSVYFSTNLMSGFQCVGSNIPWTQASFTNATAVPCGYYKIDVKLAP